MSTPTKVLVIGSGPLQIGQAGEFDYSGSQALKALREEGIRTILVNPNIATVQTDNRLADRVYLQPIEPDIIADIIQAEEIDGALLGFGGQSALNCGIALHDQGILARHGVRVLGTSIESIRDSEDRGRFASKLKKIGLRTARSYSCASIGDARGVIAEHGLPVMLRIGFALGGKGSGVIEEDCEIESALKRAFANGGHVVVEESLRGWKEVEYEVVRDRADNCITVCNMENFDPMGIHTGESIVVAPSQTLDDCDYQMLRTASIEIARLFEIVGECNVQFALDPNSREFRVIEINARLSRSSALASKATGYPLAYVAARLGLGHLLPDIRNGITGKTTAFFEPALDYLVCKIPRWDLTKFGGALKVLGSEMKSVGEVMAIGRTFPEVLQKGLRMLDIGVKGLEPDAFSFDDIRFELRHATPRRVFALARAIRDGITIEEIHALTSIDLWFLRQIERVVQFGESCTHDRRIQDTQTMEQAKRLGFSDQHLDEIIGADRGYIRDLRLSQNLHPRLVKIDTTAAEFPAQTNYMYSTYHASRDENFDTGKPRVLILGSGVFRIGSSVEFDWCCVSAARAAAQTGFETVMLNYNPETVSTDYDICDYLVFDEISFESVLELCRSMRPIGVVVSMGGQIPNNLALRLHSAGVPILGTPASSIDTAEDREKFGVLLDRLGIQQPAWRSLTDASMTEEMVQSLGGFPVLVRPSYVLSGAAMSIAHEINELREILRRAKRVSSDHPVVITKFETHAREFEIDAVAKDGIVKLWAICEHIENAGVHSGDATLVMPPQSMYLPTIRSARQIAERLARAINITGPFNVQFIAKNNIVKVIECNLRASRSFPFVSKLLGVNFAAHAVKCMLNSADEVTVNPLEIDWVGVKAPMFSFPRLHGVDPIAGVEMASTGEVGCVAGDLPLALLAAARSTGFVVPRRGVLLSLGPVTDKFLFTDDAKVLSEDLGLALYATPGTASMLREIGLKVNEVEKAEGGSGTAVAVIERGLVDLVVNVPVSYDSLGRPDGYAIRRAAIDRGVPLITDPHLAKAMVAMLSSTRGKLTAPRALGDYIHGQVPI